MPGTLVDRNGRPLLSSKEVKRRKRIQDQIMARYDAAQTSTGNQNHWANADHLDPHSANSLPVRRTLRSRSRYEVIENNPFLKGTILTIASDFVGSGPKLEITDKRLSRERKRLIEQRWNQWTRIVKLRKKLWRMRMAKITDGESFLRFYTYGRQRHPVKLNCQVLECDIVSTDNFTAGAFKTAESNGLNEIDGVRFDRFENPVSYHVLNTHPGSTTLFAQGFGGDWVDARFMLHWFRQDRGWLRGIPETTPSLPLCAILRRYTLAVLRHKEFAADFSGVLETEGPPSQTAWTDENGNLVDDDPFDTFPIEMGMVTTMPWGYKMKQMDAVPDGQQYDAFVGSILREITRPILSPFNITVGTSKDSNMASAVVDTHIYRGGQEQERRGCEEDVLDPTLDSWWFEGIRTPDYFDDPAIAESDFLLANPTLREEPPEHSWRWDKVGIDHTDPQKVAQSLAILHDKKFITDRDIQETEFNRSVDDWREQVREDDEFRQEFAPEPPTDDEDDEEESETENEESED